MERHDQPDARTWQRLARVGRARRLGAASGEELWRLPAADEARAERLLALGRQGLGGFFDGGRDEEGPWLRRAPLEPTLAARLATREPMPWREALGIAAALAHTLAACEAASLFPGPLVPEAVVWGPARSGTDPVPRPFVAAQALVGALVGGDPGRARAGPSATELRHAPPGQDAGAAWDAAANRYALGVLLYALVAGEHPFGSSGLRHALAEAETLDAPPFAPSIASALPLGLQSYCLRLVDRQRARRPADAATIARTLEGVLARGIVDDAARRAEAPAERARHDHEHEPTATRAGAPVSRRATAGTAER
ncbi:MAG: hypothetical protein HY908_01045, partial [Myxococcales bacterium]|nr:hypothetical protein [Myxococcales bacterium]